MARRDFTSAIITTMKQAIRPRAITTPDVVQNYQRCSRQRDSSSRMWSHNLNRLDVNARAKGHGEGWRTTMKKRSMFGIHCVRCDYEIIAPKNTEFLDDRVIRHLWHCPRCKAKFESFPRFPRNAQSIRELTAQVDVFPPLNEP